MSDDNDELLDKMRCLKQQRDIKLIINSRKNDGIRIKITLSQVLSN